MKSVVLACLGFLVVTGSCGAHTLGVPPRATNDSTGSRFVEIHSGARTSSADINDLASLDILRGNVPDFLRQLQPVNVTNVVTGKTNIGRFWVTPDYLALGTDDDYLLMPMMPETAQEIADALACTLPTRKMVDAIYAAAPEKLAPAPIPPSPAMTTLAVFAAHNEIVRTQRAATLKEFPLGTLVAGHKKDVVISARLADAPGKVAIYGWHQTNGTPIQPLYTKHASTWVDYSHGIRLVHQAMEVNGQTMNMARVLADPELCGLLSDEGVITNGRYPSRHDHDTGLLIGHERFPAGFTNGPAFGELTREIPVEVAQVRIVINTPPAREFATNRPVLLVLYALPNGNTIEQTFGKRMQPGDDWHYDIQHIGAQTRWLRHAITNRTIVVAYLEAATKSWPAWRKTHEDTQIHELVEGVKDLFSDWPQEIVLTGHSGGGSFTFGYLNAFTNVPDDVVRIAFLDSNYGYDTAKHAAKLTCWLKQPHRPALCVLAYQDYLARLEEKQFVSEAGGTWGKSQLMLADLAAPFSWACEDRPNGLQIHRALDGRVEFLLKVNPEQKIYHTVQVERNGFIHALLIGTPLADQGYDYFGPRAYDEWIAEH